MKIQAAVLMQPNTPLEINELAPVRKQNKQRAESSASRGSDTAEADGSEDR